MTISELRIIFKDRSGDINIADIDIDRYINSGIELLDLLTEFSHAPAKYYGELAIGDSIHTFGSKSRVVKEVWILDSVGKRTKLDKLPLSELTERYPDASNLTNARSIYYAVDINRAFPVSFDETNLPADFRPFINTVAADYNIKGITFMPPVDAVYVIEIIGKFHSFTLDDSNMQNWWSVNYADLVILSAMYQLETHYRNMEGAQGYMNTITKILKGISYDKAEEDAQDYNNMRG